MQKYLCSNCGHIWHSHEVKALTIKELKAIGLMGDDGFIKPVYNHLSLTHCIKCSSIHIHLITT